jgi:hypothetical protein
MLRSKIRRRLGVAAVVVSTALASVAIAGVALAETQAGTGTLSGTLTAPDGPSASVDVYVSPAGDRYTTTATDFGVSIGADGRGQWQVDVPPGDYVVAFARSVDSGSVRQWAPQSPRMYGAQPVTVRVGETTTLDETLLGIGRLSGHFANADGTPANNWTALLEDRDGSWIASTSLDDAGAFSFGSVLATGYKVAFDDWSTGRNQWAYGRTSADAADLISVAVGAETVVNDRLLASGTVVVRPMSAQNHKPITGFCAYWNSVPACDGGTGVAELTGVSPGDQYIALSVDDDRYFGEYASVAVAPGGSVTYSPTLRPAANIVTTIRDRVTGAPVANVCGMALPVAAAKVPQGMGDCSDETGKIVLGPVETGSYNLFVAPSDGRYGAQWVGPSGGVGRAASALVVKAKTGSVATIPPILLDEAGTISGTVTGDGAPLQYADIDLESVDPGFGGVFGAYTDEDGHYTFTGLGPYDWPLYVSAHGWAEEWSGGAVTREDSTPVRVRSGETTTFDVALTKGVTISGSVRDASGTPASVFVIAVNVGSGDLIGSTWTTEDGSYTLQVRGSQKVKLRVVGSIGPDGPWVESWYDSPTYKKATALDLPATGCLAIDITAYPQSS